MAIIDEILRSAHWIGRIALDWRERVVEHTTPSGLRRRVKIKSLPPEEQEKYRPQKVENEIPETQNMPVTPEDKLQEKVKQFKVDQYLGTYTKKFAKIRKHTFDKFVPAKIKKHSDKLILKGLTTGYNIDPSHRAGVNVSEKDYSQALTDKDTPQIFYHMYKDHDGHGKELLERLHKDGLAINYDITTMASTVLWDDSWDKEPEMTYEKVDGKTLGRSLQYSIIFKPKNKKEADKLADKLNEVANRNEKNPNAKGAIEKSWFVPDIRSTGGRYDEYEKNYVNYKAVGNKDLMFLSKKPQQADGFNSSELYLNPELSEFIK